MEKCERSGAQLKRQSPVKLHVFERQTYRIQNGQNLLNAENVYDKNTTDETAKNAL